MDLNVAIGLAWFAVFLFSVTVHEASHAWVARLGGDDTAYLGGQVSLNPIPHIRREPFGMVLMPILTIVSFGFPIGFAHAPFDPSWAMHYPKRAAIMALAGPTSNFIIATLCLITFIISIKLKIFIPIPGSLQVVGSLQSDALNSLGLILSMLFFMNLLLFIFNILPLPPMDGASVIPLFLKGNKVAAYLAFIHQPMLQIGGIFIGWMVIGYLFVPFFDFVVQLFLF